MDSKETGQEAIARRLDIEMWAKANGLEETFCDHDLIWNDDGSASVEGSLMLANTEATKLPEGLILESGDVVYVRADQEELKAYLTQNGLAFSEISDPRAEQKMAA